MTSPLAGLAFTRQNPAPVSTTASFRELQLAGSRGGHLRTTANAFTHARRHISLREVHALALALVLAQERHELAPVQADHVVVKVFSFA